MNGGKKIIGYLKFAVYEERGGLMKNYIFLFLGLLILFFLSPCFVSFIISTPSPIGFITVDQQEAWISFYGSLLGGILTLLGVGWTIFSTDLIRKKDQKKHEEEIKKEYERRDMEIKKSLSVQYKPILNISFNSDFITDKLFGVSTYKGFYIQNDMSLSDEIELKKRIAISLFVLNIGRGEARKLKIESKIISANGEQWKTVTREYEELYISNGISINFYKILNEKEWKQYENNLLAQPVRMYFRIVYEDLVGYKHSLKSFVSIKKFIHIKNENNELIPDVLFLNPYDSIIQNVTSSKEVC